MSKSKMMEKVKQKMRAVKGRMTVMVERRGRGIRTSVFCICNN